MRATRLIAAALFVAVAVSGAPGAALAGDRGEVAVPEPLEEAASAELMRSLALPASARIEVRSAWAADRTLLRGRLIRVSVPPRQSPAGRVLVRVTVADRGRERDGWVKLDVRVTRPQVVVVHEVRRGETLTARDVRVETREWAGGEVVEDAADVVGNVARRTLRAGRPIDARWLKAVDVAERGSRLRGTVRRGAVTIVTSLEALEAGAAGDTVRAKVVMTGKVVEARLTGPGRAEVLTP